MNLREARSQVRRRARATSTAARDFFEFGGGLNLVDPPLVVKQGQVLASENYEIGISGGYERLGAFERLDGQDAPSGETYYVLPIRFGSDGSGGSSPVISPTVQAGETIHRDGGLVIGTVVDVRYLSVGGRTQIGGPESLLGGATNLERTRASGAFPVDKKWDVTPTGRDQAGVVNPVDSGPSIPRNTYIYSEASDPGVARIHRIRVTSSWHRAVSSVDHLKTTEYQLFSIFVKHHGNQYIQLVPAHDNYDDATEWDAGGGLPEVVVDLSDMTIERTSGDVISAGFEDFDYQNGWKRLWIAINPPQSAITDADGMQMKINIWASLDETNDKHVPGGGSVGVQIGGPQNLIETTQMGVDDLPPFRSSETGVGEPTDSGQDCGVGYIVYRSQQNTPYDGFAGSQDLIEDSAGLAVCWGAGNAEEKNAVTMNAHLGYLNDIAGLQRANILAVPGGGNMRGVWFYNGVLYAFRDDDDTNPTKSRMYKSTASGWSEVTFNVHADFILGGPTEIAEGDTVVDSVTGASATVMRVNVTDADWAGVNATGTLVLGTVTVGAFTGGNDFEVGAAYRARINGNEYTPTFVFGGKYEFRTYNFFGASDLKRMYGVNGLDPLFEYDDGDEVLGEIKTGMAVDTPTHLATHLYMIFLSFPGGSIQNSGVGAPGDWTVVSGASEIAVGDNCTGFLEEVGDSLFIFTRNQKYQLNGKSVVTFDLQRFDTEAGAVEWSMQRIGMGLHLDDRGFGSLVTTDRFGNYEGNTFSREIQTLVDTLLRTTSVTTSVIYRRRNRYRCFFSDGQFISIGVDGQNILGSMTCDYGVTVRVACSVEDTDGVERVFFGSDDGYIYEAEKGTSFDGAPIRAAMRLVSHHSGAPDRNKRYRRARTEALLGGRATISVVPTYGENDPQHNAFPSTDITPASFGMSWDDGHEWELFNWDEEVNALKPVHLEAVAPSIALSYVHESEEEMPHTLRGVNLSIAGRRIERDGHG